MKYNPNISSSSRKESSSTMSQTNDSFHYEFGGRLGATFNLIALPMTVYLLYLLCNPYYTLTFSFNLPAYHQFLTLLYNHLFPQIFNIHSFFIYLSWYFLHVL